ncbi:Tetratricopeptide repeat protein 39B [Zancudomyces culisetae]|uniref:Tetratricopeptide repeat protein 39B n=1 Tax=Zancudomyces culisetae TaxID=1213189 RepID=A0A1R1PXZ8_ZANCU|nr:Tetratricopeptide repeat protein 39B [Zancudomyces culisetae]|eukprot:OMH85851.1 Tetratricopeptide repeat protein 39B [Zancudomyces culisetae]
MTSLEMETEGVARDGKLGRGSTFTTRFLSIRTKIVKEVGNIGESIKKREGLSGKDIKEKIKSKFKRKDRNVYTEDDTGNDFQQEGHSLLHSHSDRDLTRTISGEPDRNPIQGNYPNETWENRSKDNDVYKKSSRFRDFYKRKSKKGHVEVMDISGNCTDTEIVKRKNIAKKQSLITSKKNKRDSITLATNKSFENGFKKTGESNELHTDDIKVVPQNAGGILDKSVGEAAEVKRYQEGENGLAKIDREHSDNAESNVGSETIIDKESEIGLQSNSTNIPTNTYNRVLDGVKPVGMTVQNTQKSLAYTRDDSNDVTCLEGVQSKRKQTREENYGDARKPTMGSEKQEYPQYQKKEIQGLLDAYDSLKLFINAKYEDSEKIFRARMDEDNIYILEGYAMIQLVKAMVTFDRSILEETFRASTQLVDKAQKRRKTAHGKVVKGKESTKGAGIAGAFYGMMVSGVNMISGAVIAASSTALGSSEEAIYGRLRAMSIEQRHAELICAEGILMKAVANIVINEGILGFLKEGWNIKTAISIYKESYRFLKWAFQTQEENDIYEQIDDEYISGVYLGVGIFNIVMSMLPKRVLKMVSLLGLSGSREVGLDLLAKSANVYNYREIYKNMDIDFERGNISNDYTGSSDCNDSASLSSRSSTSSINTFFTAMEEIEEEKDNVFDRKRGLRSQLSYLVLLGFHTVVCPESCIRERNGVEFAKKIIEEQVTEFPNSHLINFFAGRIEELEQRSENAIQLYSFVASSGQNSERMGSVKQNENVNAKINDGWIKMTHLGVWQKSLVLLGMRRWEEACEGFEVLRTQSRWSTAVYTYCVAVCRWEKYLELSKTKNHSTDPSTLKKMFNDICELFESVEKLKKKIAGKTVPAEKYVTRKSKKFFLQKKYLMRPGLELLLIYNCIPKMSQKTVDELVLQVNSELESLLSISPPSRTDVDGDTSVDFGDVNKSTAYVDESLALGEFGRISIQTITKAWLENDNKDVSCSGNYKNDVFCYRHAYYSDDLALLLTLKAYAYNHLSRLVSKKIYTEKALRDSQSTFLTELTCQYVNYTKLARIFAVRCLRLSGLIKLDHYTLAASRFILGCIYLDLDIELITSYDKSKQSNELQTQVHTFEYESSKNLNLHIAQHHLKLIMDTTLFSSYPECFDAINTKKQSSSDETLEKSVEPSLDSLNVNHESNYCDRTLAMEWWFKPYFDSALFDSLVKIRSELTGSFSTSCGDLLKDNIEHNEDEDFELSSNLHYQLVKNSYLEQPNLDLQFGWSKATFNRRYLLPTLSPFTFNNYNSNKDKNSAENGSSKIIPTNSISDNNGGGNTPKYSMHGKVETQTHNILNYIDSVLSQT